MEFGDFRAKKSFFKGRLLLCQSEEISAKVTRVADLVGIVQALLGTRGKVN